MSGASAASSTGYDVPVPVDVKGLWVELACKLDDGSAIEGHRATGEGHAFGQVIPEDPFRARLHVPSVPMLVLFDVDGTLTATDALDGEVYAHSFEAVFGTALPTTNWAEYACPTDQGIADEAVRRLRLNPRRTTDFKQRFVVDLRRELALRGARPIPGATNVLGRLATAGHAVAFATGAWEQSARAKLAAAGIEIGEHVLVGSDFDVAREEIVREARRRSGARGCAVYIGDGLWDARAARALDLPFVGVDPERAGVLRAAGVRQVIDGYEDFEVFLQAVQDAVVP